jgi:hypothetical protein
LILIRRRGGPGIEREDGNMHVGGRSPAARPGRPPVEGPRPRPTFTCRANARGRNTGSGEITAQALIGGVMGLTCHRTNTLLEKAMEV